MPLFKKKAEMPTPEEIEAGKVKSYKDLIAVSYTHLDVYKRQATPSAGAAATVKPTATPKPESKTESSTAGKASRCV